MGLLESALHSGSNHQRLTPAKVTCPQGATLFAQGDLSQDVYVVRRGWMCLTHATLAGHTFMIRLLGRGDIVGKSALLEEATRRAYAQALETTQLLRFTPQDFLAVIAQTHGGVQIRTTVVLGCNSASLQGERTGRPGYTTVSKTKGRDGLSPPLLFLGQPIQPQYTRGRDSSRSQPRALAAHNAYLAKNRRVSRIP